MEEITLNLNREVTQDYVFFKFMNRAIELFAPHIDKYIVDKDVINYFNDCILNHTKTPTEFIESLKTKKDFKWKFKNILDNKWFVNEANNMLNASYGAFIISEVNRGNIEVECLCCFDNYHDENYQICCDLLEVVANFVDGKNVKVVLENPLYDTGRFYDKETTENIQKINENYYNLYIKDINAYITFSQVLEAQDKANMLIDKIKSLDLSPFEQYLLVYDFVAGKPYNISEDSQFDCRNYIHSMISNQINCVGYASLVSHLCNELGIECDFVGGKPNDLAHKDKPDLLENGHQFNIVHLVDPKYDIDGWYLCDITANDEALMFGLRDYNFTALPLQDVKYSPHKYYFDKKYTQYILIPDDRVYPEYSTPIPFETFETALKKAYTTLNEEQHFSNEFVEDSLDVTSYNSLGFIDNPNAENCFTKRQLEIEKNLQK